MSSAPVAPKSSACRSTEAGLGSGRHTCTCGRPREESAPMLEASQVRETSYGQGVAGARPAGESCDVKGSGSGTSLCRASCSRKTCVKGYDSPLLTRRSKPTGSILRRVESALFSPDCSEPGRDVPSTPAGARPRSPSAGSGHRRHRAPALGRLCAAQHLRSARGGSASLPRGETGLAIEPGLPEARACSCVIMPQAWHGCTTSALPFPIERNSHHAYVQSSRRPYS
jgi:hypothetical protein